MDRDVGGQEDRRRHPTEEKAQILAVTLTSGATCETARRWRIGSQDTSSPGQEAGGFAGGTVEAFPPGDREPVPAPAPQPKVRGRPDHRGQAGGPECAVAHLRRRRAGDSRAASVPTVCRFARTALQPDGAAGCHDPEPQPEPGLRAGLVAVAAVANEPHPGKRLP
jgi:transposase-like protein